MSKIIKQHNDASYSKEQNDVEKYLMKIIQRYFLVEQEYSEGQKEAIIVESIRRIKIYLAEHKAGVFAINHKTGIVHFDITDFDGEPEFEKNNSFNKDFGNSADTICQGNDIRLSNKRIPIKHTHYIDDIDGLEEALYERYSINIVGHEHTEKDALDKIIYTGDSPEVDLILFEQFLDMVSMFITQLKILQINTEDIHDKFKEFISNAEARVANMSDIYAEFMKEQSWLQDAKDYADERSNDFTEMCRQKLRSYMTDEEFKELLNDLNFVGSSNGYLNFNPEEEVKISITDEHIVESFDIAAAVYDDHTSMPVQGISVQLDNGQTVITNAEGKYSFSNVSRGEHVLTFTKSNYHTTKMYIFLNDSNSGIEDIYIVPIMVTLTVTVKGTSDEPLLAGAIVRLSELNLTAVTDNTGTCEFKVYQNRSYTLNATCNDYNASVNVTVSSHETDFTATITLTPITHVLTVRAVDISTNMNIERTDTVVRVVGVGVTYDSTQSTNANGTVQFTVRQNRDYRISISNKRYLPYDDTDIHIGNTDVEKVLKLTRKTVSLTVYVKGSPSDEPVLAGSTITMNGTNYTTDNNGSYVLTVPNYESYTITAKYPDYVDKSGTAVINDSDETLTITLNPVMHNLTVNVKEMYTDNNLSGASVNIVIDGTIVGRTSSTDSNGNVTFEIRQNRVYKLKVTKSGYIASEEYTIPGKTADSTFNVVLKHEQITIMFSVKSEENSPYTNVEGAVISISGDSATYTTNSNGTVSASIDPYRQYTFTATLPTSDAYPNDEYTTRTLTETKTINELTNVSQSFLFKAARYNINITIKDEDGNIIVGQPVSINGTTVNTGSNGIATLECRCKRLYLVSVSRTGYVPVINDVINLETSDYNKTISLTLVVTTLNVFVKDYSGSFMSGVSFTLKNVTDNVNETVTGTTGSDGKKVFTLKANKTYKITASKSGYSDASLDYTPGNIITTDTKTLTLQLANHIKGRVLNTRTNTGISGATVSINDTEYTATTDDNGYYDIVGVPGGTYSFTVSKANFETDSTTLVDITIENGEDKNNVDVLLTPELAVNQYEYNITWSGVNDVDIHASGQFIEPSNPSLTQWYAVGYGNGQSASYGGSSIYWDTDQTFTGGHENITLTLIKGNSFFSVTNWSNGEGTVTYKIKKGGGTNGGWTKTGTFAIHGSGDSGTKPVYNICMISDDGSVSWYV